MKTTSRGRGHGRSDRGRPSFGRRQPPPESTGFEVEFLEASRKTGRQLVLRLNGGETIQGQIEAFDREMLWIRPAAGPVRLLRKSQVRYLHEAD